MATPNISEIAATTIEARSKVIADNVTRNNALLFRLSQRGNIKTFSGGRLIYEELSFRENSNFGWYSGYDTLPVAAQEVLTAASFDIKQAAAPVTISGLELLQNAGGEQMIDLLESKLQVAESTMKNGVSASLYSDGTGYGGKEINGLDIAVPVDPTTGTYGGIDRATWSFWRSKVYDPASTPTASTIQGYMNLLWAQLVRGSDKPDLIMAGTTIWATYMSSLQAQQRFTDAKMAEAGFENVKFMSAPVVLDNNGATATDMYFLNTEYLRLRPHKDRNFTSAKGARLPINQDAQVEMIFWAGNLTCSASFLQGRFIGS
jgi:hypothetical protein